MIWFATIRLGKQVHAQGLGFTNCLFLFAYGENREEANANLSRFIKAKELDFLSAEMRLADHQDVSRFSAPEFIIGLPKHLLPDTSVIH